MKLLAHPDKRAQFIEQLNNFLPEDIRAFTMTKVTKGFNAKSHCTKRRYHYLLPTYALQPHGDLTALLAEQYKLQGPVAGAGAEGGYLEDSSKRGVGREGLETVYAAVKGYRATPDTIARLRGALKLYVGTRGYHNFTTGKLPSDANAKRFIISFDCGEPFVDGASGVEWVQLTVLGQSFLLNQIRKMVGMAVEVCRGATPASTIHDAFTTRKVSVRRCGLF
jgi:tRNA pseudouridine38-40 synthase